MFSRVARELDAPKNPLYRLRDELSASGREIVDLVSGNVTEHGIRFPQELLEEILIEAVRRSSVYRPDPLGQPEARAAIGSYYAAAGLAVAPEHIVLTPGTSVSYWYAFKLLADPGEEILAPRPSYPLFDYIAALAGISMIPYRMVESRGWAIDLDRLEDVVSTATRALVLISPHNPTGHVVRGAELEGVCEIARRHDLALILDEVFCEFLLDQGSFQRPSRDVPLLVLLNGFSKMFALPGVKLGWMALTGEPERVRRALSALELVSDTFLPVNEVVQATVPAIFGRGRDFLSAYRSEICARFDRARAIIEPSRRIRFVSPEGGFYLTLRLEEIPEQAAGEALLRRGFLVHPGHFYDVDGDHLIASFTLEAERLDPALRVLVQTLDEWA